MRGAQKTKQGAAANRGSPLSVVSFGLLPLAGRSLLCGRLFCGRLFSGRSLFCRGLLCGGRFLCGSRLDGDFLCGRSLKDVCLFRCGLFCGDLFGLLSRLRGLFLGGKALFATDLARAKPRFAKLAAKSFRVDERRIGLTSHDEDGKEQRRAYSLLVVERA